MEWNHSKGTTESWTSPPLGRTELVSDGITLVLMKKYSPVRLTVSRWWQSNSLNPNGGPGTSERRTDEMTLCFYGTGARKDGRSLVDAVMSAENADDAYALARSHQSLREL